MASITFKLGSIYRTTFLKLFKMRSTYAKTMEWEENKGFFSSSVTITSKDDDDILYFKDVFDRMNKA